MKIRLLLPIVALALLTTRTYSQGAGPGPVEGTFTFFAEEGEKFTLYLNGELENKTPMSRVVVEGVKELNLAARVVFEDASIPAIKKSLLRMGKDCTYIIKKNKKGEYVLNLNSAEGSLGTSPSAVAPAAAPAIATEPLKASYSEGTITISDGRHLYVTKAKTPGGWPQPHVIMNNPKGAQVTITYDDNKETYKTEVPFDYEVKDYMNNNSYFRLTVDEGGPDKTWYVRLQNGTAYQLTIE